MNNHMLAAIPGGVSAAPPDCQDSAAGVITRPAGPTVIARTTSGAYELQALRLPCGVRDCEHPAAVVLGSRGFRQDRPDGRGGQFCAVHGFERLGQLDPMRTREVAA